jgi:hypothetical protein
VCVGPNVEERPDVVAVLDANPYLRRVKRGEERGPEGGVRLGAEGLPARTGLVRGAAGGGHLAHAGLAPVADARRERPGEPALLIFREGDTGVVGVREVEGLERALEDVLGQRAARRLARRALELHGAGGRVERYRRRDIGLVCTVGGNAEVGRAGGLVGAHLGLDRLIARVLLDVREPRVERGE